MSLTVQKTLALPMPPGLVEQLLSFRRRWHLIFICTLLVPCVAWLVLAHLPVTYAATGILLYDPEATVVPGDTTTPLADAQNEDAVIASQGEVIASLPVARQLVAKLHLAGLAEYRPQRRWPRWLFAAPAAPSADCLVDTVRRALDVTVSPGSRIISVSYTSRDPALAAQAANLTMQLYLDHQREVSFASLSDAQSWLETHSETVQAALDQTETALANARAAAGVVQGAQASLTTETVSRLAASLVQAQADLAMNQARQKTAVAGDAAAANAAIAPNLLPLRKEQADLTASVDSLQAVYGAQYPDLQVARTQLGAITAEINAESGREVDAAAAEVAADQAEIQTLRAALAVARTDSQTEDEESAPIRALEQRADAGRAMLRAMTLQADQLAQDASLTKPGASILSTAAVPTIPSTPRASLVLGAAAALGFWVGVLLAGLAAALDTSFRSGGEVRAELGMSCLALLPEVAAPNRAALDAPFSLFAEQLRALRTGLRITPDQGARIIAVTAARPGEGKTTLTIALARALAAAGLRTLAVDGDIRQPSFDPVFHTGGALGLTDHLAGLATLSEIIHHDRLSPLCVIPAGTQAQHALSLFLSPALPDCLDALRRKYDVIFLDAPPAFALAEGRVLARLADSALLCIRWGRTPRRVVQAALTLLSEDGVNIAGAALTRVGVKAHGRSGFADAEIYQPRYGGYFR
jgi:capsular exopolysaccharide synthesis family protein